MLINGGGTLWYLILGVGGGGGGGIENQRLHRQKQRIIPSQETEFTQESSYAK